jgi:hypothetical protein
MNRAARTRTNAYPSEAVSLRASEFPYTVFPQAPRASLTSPKLPSLFTHGKCGEMFSSVPCVITVGASPDRLSDERRFRSSHARAR